MDAILDNHPAYDATVVSFTDDIRTITNLDDTETLADVLIKFGENIGERGGTSFQSVIDLVTSDDSPVELNALNLLCIVSADAAGGKIYYNEKFQEMFHGKLLFLVDDHYKSDYITDAYTSGEIGNFERDILYFTNK